MIHMHNAEVRSGRIRFNSYFQNPDLFTLSHFCLILLTNPFIEISVFFVFYPKSITELILNIHSYFLYNIAWDYVLQ